MSVYVYASFAIDFFALLTLTVVNKFLTTKEQSQTLKNMCFLNVVCVFLLRFP